MNLQKTINTQKYMNYKKWIIGLCILNILPALSQEYNIENIHIDGYIGNRINTCIEHQSKIPKYRPPNRAFQASKRGSSLAI